MVASRGQQDKPHQTKYPNPARHYVDMPSLMMGGPADDEARFDRSKCALGRRDGDDPKTAIYHCAGCGETKRGFTGWRNHMKKAAAFKKKSGGGGGGGSGGADARGVGGGGGGGAGGGERRSNASTNPRPAEAEAEPEPEAEPEAAAAPALKPKLVVPKKPERPPQVAASKPPPSKGKDGAAAAGGAETGGGAETSGKRKRVRGPGNELRRLKHAEKVRLRQEAANRGDS